MDLFPEKWYIEITDENRHIVNPWKISQYYNDDLFKFNHYKYVKYTGSAAGRERDGSLVEITTEQFEIYVLGKPDKVVEDNNDRLLAILKERGIV